jgi:hypothetical protein
MAVVVVAVSTAVAVVAVSTAVAVVAASTVVVGAAISVAAGVGTLALRAAAVPFPAAVVVTPAAAIEAARLPRDLIPAVAAGHPRRAAGRTREIVGPQGTGLPALVPREQMVNGILSTARIEALAHPPDAVAPAIPSRNHIHLDTAGLTAVRRAEARHALVRQQAHTLPA